MTQRQCEVSQRVVMHRPQTDSSVARLPHAAVPQARSASHFFAFVHIPKTAGTSVRQALQATLGNALLVVERSENLFFLDYPCWLGKQVAIGHVSLPLLSLFGAQRWGTCLRHPLARCVSQVRHWLRPATVAPEVDRFGRDLPAFEPERGVAWNMAMVLEWGDGDRFLEISNAMTYQLIDDPQFRVLSPDEHGLRLATDVLDTASCLAVTEDAAGLARGLCGVLGIDAVLGHANSSSSNSQELVQQLPRDVLRRLERANELDLALYEHALGIIGARRWYAADPERALRSALPRIFDLRSVRGIGRDFMAHFGEAPHELSGRTAHVMLDIAEFTSGLSLTGDIHLFGHAHQADLAVFAAALGPAEQLHCHDGHRDGHYNGHPDRVSVAEHVGAIGAVHARPMRAAFIQAKNEPAVVLADVQRVALSLDRSGHAVLMNALTGGGLEVAGEACKIFSRNGFLPLAVIDRHALFCGLPLRPAMAALLKAKFNECSIGRIMIAGLSCLEITSDY